MSYFLQKIRIMAIISRYFFKVIFPTLFLTHRKLVNHYKYLTRKQTELSLLNRMYKINKIGKYRENIEHCL